ncbi:response regulator transcription factor [Variovorax sp. J22R133]|uniref:response regulator n=1 Tax=Variovorax brevis TaxID=3053503 RepID=UPI0025787131|nr:response regulator transcription factor [Variovorax sp. J22R133]MDM0110804.1 response regulator transcription factor [Variovorax sp. J22R133]
MRVLLVDDSASIQQSFGALLATAPGVEVVGYAQDFETARESIASRHPDLIVLDAKLRGRDRGLDVMRHVRQHYPDIKVIILSQYGWASMRKVHLEGGALAYFDKGLEFQQARDWIAELASAHNAKDTSPKER